MKSKKGFFTMYPSPKQAALLVALVAVSLLEGAPPILAKDHIAQERKALKTRKLGEQVVLVELGLADELAKKNPTKPTHDD